MNGAGVTVAFLADGINVNTPDLIRANGQHAITVYKDFTGEGTTDVSTSGSEAFGDASSIAAQGRFAYNADSYVNQAQPQHKSCLPIRVLGMAPGASVMALKVFAHNGGDEGTAIQAVQFAVSHGANVINESLSAYRNPDSGFDPLQAANDAAVAAGVVVVGISWDAGTAGGTMFPPGTDPQIITAGASTQFQSYRQVSFAGSQVIKGGFTSNNISAISSSGVSDDGKKTVDVVAPGDLGWALCAPTSNFTYFTGCYSDNYQQSPIQLFGGTSEAAPLTAGEAALVIQAYRKAHGGKSPSPAVVKQIIMSTATDLGAPAAEQGAGLIDSLTAVRAAMSYSLASRSGAALLTSPASLSATLSPGKTTSFSISVTNDGAIAQTVTPRVISLGPPFSEGHFTSYFDGPKAKSFTDVYGATDRYITQRFTVPSGAQRLDAAIAWPSPNNTVRLTLFDPHGNVAGYTLPQDVGYPNGPSYSQYGHAGIRNPEAGTWTALISTPGSVVGYYKGTIHLDVSESRFAPYGTVFPTTKKLAPGQTGSFRITVASPDRAGDFEPQVQIKGVTSSGATTQAGAVPILIRNVVPIGSTGGSFSGVLTGGNGRPGRGQGLDYSFKLPKGLQDVDISLSLADSGYNLEGILSGPNGMPLDVQSTIADSGNGAPTGYGKTMQLFRRTPAPGLWSLLVFINDNTSGRETSETLNGFIRFNRVAVSTRGVPDSASTRISPGGSRVATVTVKNTGIADESFFVDPRLTSEQTLTVAGGSYNLSPLTSRPFFVPPETTRITASAVSTSASIPIAEELENTSGAAPYGYLDSPLFEGAPGVTGAGEHSVTTTVSASELTCGQWTGYPSAVGPFTNAAPASTVTDSYRITTQAFDPNAIPSTGDAWSWQLGRSKTYTALILAPGASGKITVTFKAAQQVGKVVSGNLYVDTYAVWNGHPITGSSDELDAIPYKYSVS